MRAGCSGCVSILVAGALLTLVGASVIGAGSRMLAPPGASPVTTSADGARAQRKLLELARGRRAQTVAFSEGELNALLARHLVEVRGVRLSGLSARLIGSNRLQVTARTHLRRLLEEASLGLVADALPAGWQARPIELRVGARVRIDDEGPRQLRMEVDEFAVGRQRLPAFALRLLADPATIGLLRWRLPDHVESVAVEPGRVVIRTAS